MGFSVFNCLLKRELVIMEISLVHRWRELAKMLGLELMPLYLEYGKYSVFALQGLDVCVCGGAVPERNSA